MHVREPLQQSCLCTFLVCLHILYVLAGILITGRGPSGPKYTCVCYNMQWRVAVQMIYNWPLYYRCLSGICRSPEDYNDDTFHYHHRFLWLAFSLKKSTVVHLKAANIGRRRPAIHECFRSLVLNRACSLWTTEGSLSKVVCTKNTQSWGGKKSSCISLLCSHFF